MAELDAKEALQFLERTPSILRSLLVGLPDGWADETTEDWRACQVVAHLLYADRAIWPVRARMIAVGDPEPFPNGEIPEGFDDWRAKDLEELVGTFSGQRALVVSEMEERLRDPVVLTTWGQHPFLGPVNLANLLNTWVVHDLTHTAQITRILSRTLRGAMGRWDDPGVFPRLRGD